MLMKRYQEKAFDISMVKRLYAEEDQDESDLDYNSPKINYKAKLLDRKQFAFNHITALPFFYFYKCCCCLKDISCLQYNSYRRAIQSYKRMRVATNRMHQEYDILHIVRLNRISKLLHRSYFNLRQQLSVDFSKMYTITNDDIADNKLRRRLARSSTS